MLYSKISLKNKTGKYISIPVGFFGDFESQNKITIFTTRLFKESKNSNSKKRVRRSLKKKFRNLNKVTLNL